MNRVEWASCHDGMLHHLLGGERDSLQIWTQKLSMEHRPSVKRFVSLQFLNLRQFVGFPEREISPSQGRCLNTGQHKHRINVDKHICLEWDSNTRSQCSCLRLRGHSDQRAQLPIYWISRRQHTKKVFLQPETWLGCQQIFIVKKKTFDITKCHTGPRPTGSCEHGDDLSVSIK
jgi:hypothetical protein